MTSLPSIGKTLVMNCSPDVSCLLPETSREELAQRLAMAVRWTVARICPSRVISMPES
jgi:hypothetical protein